VILSRLIRYVTFFIRYKLAFYLLVFLSFFLSQWDSASSSWTKIGDVVDAVGSRQKQLYEGKEYDYVRPLATIEPTAIWFGLPIKADIGVSDIKGLEAALDRKRYRDALVFVAWEHKTIEDMVRSILSAHGGDATAVPKWAGSDFDSIYVVKIARTGNAATASFTLMHQGLDGQKETCPGA